MTLPERRGEHPGAMVNWPTLSGR